MAVLVNTRYNSHYFGATVPGGTGTVWIGLQNPTRVAFQKPCRTSNHDTFVIKNVPSVKSLKLCSPRSSALREEYNVRMTNHGKLFLSHVVFSYTFPSRAKCYTGMSSKLKHI